MGIFDRFKTTERTIVPLMYYQEEEPQGQWAKDSDFSADMANAIILFCKRLHNMGALPEDKVVSWDVQSLLDRLDRMDVLHGVAIREFDAVTVGFGDDYVGQWYENQDQEPYVQYLVPRQIVIFHTKKPENYGLSLVQGKLDLAMTKVSDTNEPKIVDRIAIAQAPRWNTKQYHELKSVFHIVFTYLKYKILKEAKGKGYNDDVQRFAQAFCNQQQANELVDYCKQYFALNTEKKVDYPIAHQNWKWHPFFSWMLTLMEVGFDLQESTLLELSQFFETNYKLRWDNKYWDSKLQLLEEADKKLYAEGKRLYLMEEGKMPHESRLLVGQKENLPAMTNIVLKEWDQTVKASFEEAQQEEMTIRSLCKEHYATFGVQNIDEMLLKIQGIQVLDDRLYEESYLVGFDWKEEEMDFLLTSFLERFGIEELIAETMVDNKTLDVYRYGDDEEVEIYDRVKLYAPAILDKGYCLVYLDRISDSCDFALIKNTQEAKNKLHAIAQILMDLGEIGNYQLLD